MAFLYRSEPELEELLLRQIADIKRQYADDWANPKRLAEKLGLRVITGALGRERQGAALPGLIIVDTVSAGPARQLFTIYHELVHHLIRQNGELLSCLEDLCTSDSDLLYCIERFCNVGAAEFLVAQTAVRDAIRAEGFSIGLVRSLKTHSEASFTAIGVQLARCAAHKCAVVVCHLIQPNEEPSLPLPQPARSLPVLSIGVAATSPRMKYWIARGTPIPRNHVLAEAYEVEDKLIRGRAAIPFRRSQNWVVDCEAIRVGEQVFGLFNIDLPLQHNRDQLPLF